MSATVADLVDLLISTPARSIRLRNPPRPRPLHLPHPTRPTRSNISLGKYGTFNTRHLINQPYGHTYEILPAGELSIVRATIAEVQETAANNQNILSQSKGLEADEVARMKAEGLSGRVSWDGRVWVLGGWC